MEAATIGDTTAALRALTKAIQGKRSDDDENEDEDDDDDKDKENDKFEEGDESAVLPLPVYVHTALLLDRARLRMEAAKEQSESAERTRALYDRIHANGGELSDGEKLNDDEVLSLAQAAMNDCNEVLRMDSKCAQGYALRSQLQLMLGGSGGDGDDTAEVDCIVSNSNNGESAVLAAAAKDALAAYLVGGSTDLRSIHVP